MFEKIRSLIFKFDPETAHDLAIKSLKLNLIPRKKEEKDNSNNIKGWQYKGKDNRSKGI